MWLRTIFDEENNSRATEGAPTRTPGLFYAWLLSTASKGLWTYPSCCQWPEIRLHDPTAYLPRHGEEISSRKELSKECGEPTAAHYRSNPSKDEYEEEKKDILKPK